MRNLYARHLERSGHTLAADAIRTIRVYNGHSPKRPWYSQVRWPSVLLYSLAVGISHVLTQLLDLNAFGRIGMSMMMLAMAFSVVKR